MHSVLHNLVVWTGGTGIAYHILVYTIDTMTWTISETAKLTCPIRYTNEIPEFLRHREIYNRRFQDL